MSRNTSLSVVIQNKAQMTLKFTTSQAGLTCCYPGLSAGLPVIGCQVQLGRLPAVWWQMGKPVSLLRGVNAKWVGFCLECSFIKWIQWNMDSYISLMWKVNWVTPAAALYHRELWMKWSFMVEMNRRIKANRLNETHCVGALSPWLTSNGF